MPSAVLPAHHETVPDIDPEDSSWLGKAACRGIDPDLMFPERGASTRPAKRICSGCPVRLQCLVNALRSGEKFGIWGGASERERRRIRKRLTAGGRIEEVCVEWIAEQPDYAEAETSRVRRSAGRPSPSSKHPTTPSQLNLPKEEPDAVALGRLGGVKGHEDLPVDGQGLSPGAAGGFPRGRPWVVPGGGQQNSPGAAMGPARRGGCGGVR